MPDLSSSSSTLLGTFSCQLHFQIFEFEKQLMWWRHMTSVNDFRERLPREMFRQNSTSLQVWKVSKQRFLEARVHRNKSMQHHTLRSGTAEFQVTWPPKLREGTYLVKNVRARFEYRKDHRRAWKTCHNGKKRRSLALACDVRLYAPSESVFLQSTLQSLTMCVCLYIT